MSVVIGNSNEQSERREEKRANDSETVRQRKPMGRMAGAGSDQGGACADGVSENVGGVGDAVVAVAVVAAVAGGTVPAAGGPPPVSIAAGGGEPGRR